MSEWELRERRERQEEREVEAEELGTAGELGAGEELPLFLPTPSFMASAVESGLRGAVTQLENRRRRFGLRLLSLPQGDQA